MMSTTMTSCQHLTHKHAAYYGCTTQEMLLIVAIYTVIEVVISAIGAIFLGPYVGGYFGALLLFCLVFALLTAFVLIKQTAVYIGKLRNGRPAGYLTLRLRKLLHQHAGVTIPYVTRQGYWLTRRRLP